MKKLLSIVLFCIVCSSLMAVPAKRQRVMLTLADGSQVEAIFRGDENAHFFVAEDGRTFQKDSHGVAFEVSDREVYARWAQKLQTRNSLRLQRAQKRAAKAKDVTNPVSGTKKGLVILVNYTDKKLTYTKDDYERYFNEVGYNEHGMTGSVRDYFHDCSYGKFDLEFDVVGPITLSQNMKYYGGNDSDGNDLRPGTMVGEAVEMANSLVDYSDYDWDGDGEVDQVFVIYAGYNEAQSYIDDTVWPHEWQLSAAKYYGDGKGARTMDGVRIDTYACTGELAGRSGTTMDGIGTACHEFSHCMGIPDMYDTSGTQNFGMDQWDLMDCGSYNGAYGSCPAPYTSYERMYCGWLTPIELQDPVTIKDMPALTSEPVAYMIRNSGNSNEFYLLENHQKEKWDKSAAGHGMLILHVDYNASAWRNNEVNTTASHQRMTIIPADGTFTSTTSGLAGDPWPGTKKNTELTDKSNPSATLYNANAQGKKLMGHPITKITESSNGLISFEFDGGTVVGTPDGLEASDITGNGFTATWNAVPGADFYEVSLRSVSATADISSSVLLKEKFTGFNSGKLGMTDVGTNMDSYTTEKGWTGSKVYTTAEAMAKLGSSSALGYVETPALHPTKNIVTALVGCKKYGSDTGMINVYVDGTQVYSIVPETDETFTCIQMDAKDGMKMRVGTSEKRGYVSYIAVYDGDFSSEDVVGDMMKVRRSAAADISEIVETTNYTFSGLSNTVCYLFKVRALVGDIAGEWSEELYVELDDEDAISFVNASKADAVIYDLQGRRVAHPGKGLYIINGRKTVVD